MKKMEWLRWGVPMLGFLIYLRWGGLVFSLLLFGILFGVASAFMAWYRRDPKAFFVGIRVWIVVFLIVPLLGLTLGAAMIVPVLAPLSAIPLAASIWLITRTNKAIRRHDPTLVRRSSTH